MPTTHGRRMQSRKTILARVNGGEQVLSHQIGMLCGCLFERAENHP
jgi:hypothetical protein